MNKKIIIGSILAIMVSLGFYALQVGANPSQISETKSATATSTLTFMTTGTATTTQAINVMADGGAAADSAALAVQFTASSTSSVLKIEYEYANNTVGIDCTVTPGFCDWYSDNLTATSTTSNVVNTNNSFSWTFASSTTGGVPVTTQRANRIFGVKTPTMYVRAVMSLTGANGAVWSDWVTKREQR